MIISPVNFKIILACLLLLSLNASAKVFSAKNTEEIKAMAVQLKAGDVLNISPGNYQGGINLEKIKGTKEQPIVINGSGIDKTVFVNGRQAFHLTDCHYIILKNFSVKKFSVNGINADDGGTRKNPSSGLSFENISITEIGPQGNFDGLKLSGLHNFTVKNCYFAGWGGSAIDMVGCHSGVISNCTLKGIEKHSQNSGIQIKGGSSGIKVYRNIFNAAGQRAVNLGGSTGTKWFRPLGANYEAKDIEVAGNTFRGGMAHIAFVTSQNSHVHHNIFYRPDKWIFRILQETKDPEFIKSQSGKIQKNIFVFDSKIRTFINIGSDTLPKTFTFESNLWQDLTANRKPVLPVKELNGLYNTGAKLKQNKNGTFEVEAKYNEYGPASFIMRK